VTDHKTIAAELRRLATGTVEWRVQHPVEKCYCMSFDRRTSINPERDAREWLADHCRRHPGGLHTDYEVAEVRSFTSLERVALQAADALDSDGVNAAPETQSPPEGGEGLASQKATPKGCPCKQSDSATLRDALQQIAGMYQKGLRADDLGRAARIAHDALGVTACPGETPAPSTPDGADR
jgi:hypothetical protein